MDAWEEVTVGIEQHLKEQSPEIFLHYLSQSALLESLSQLHSAGLLTLLEEWFYCKVQEQLRGEVSKWFWQECENASLEVTDSIFVAFSKLCALIDCYCACGEKLASDSVKNKLEHSKNRILELVNAVLFTILPDNFASKIKKLYQQSLHAYAASRLNDVDLNSTGGTDDSGSLTCSGCDQATSCCVCESLLEKFRLFNQYVHKIDVRNVLLHDVCLSASDQLLKEHVESVCKDSFEKRHLSTVVDWLENILISWLHLIWSNSEILGIYKNRLLHNLHEEFARIMIGQLFSIIIEYPESLPVVEDLRDCLVKINMHAHLVQSLRTAFETRLLHPGVKTEDIITAYISTIRVMKVIDTVGSLLNAVCEPIQQYLRNREDTVRCIVFSLTDNANCELSEELMHGLMPDNSEDSEAVSWEEWKPDSVYIDSKYSNSATVSHSDIINMLVNIFGSRNVFVNEYFNLLADRILTQPGFQIEREIRYLELLKLRFGDTLFQQGEIMVKDVSDSNRINALIKDGKQKLNIDFANVPLDVLILSVQFWPQLKEEKLELPNCMKTAMEEYCKAFEKVKVNRSLTWRPNLGLVDLEIELKGRNYLLQVSPLHATLIWHFQEKKQWNIDELSQIMQVPTQVLQRKITFWLSKGLIQEEQPGMYVLNEESKDLLSENSVPMDDDLDILLLSGKNKKEEEEPVIWQYVVGMLRNFVALPLDRMHTMLKMFAMQGPGSDWTIGDLRNLLHKQVREQKLIVSGSAYRLAKE